MGRDRNTYAKRQREAEKKQKTANKSARRQKKKEEMKRTDIPAVPERAPDEQL